MAPNNLAYTGQRKAIWLSIIKFLWIGSRIDDETAMSLIHWLTEWGEKIFRKEWVNPKYKVSSQTILYASLNIIGKPNYSHKLQFIERGGVDDELFQNYNGG